MLDIGSRIGQYEIIGPGNKGGMAEVFRARHLTLKREVALKVLYPHLTSDQDFIARFEREANAQAKLKHPNIAEVYDAGYADGYYYMAMEFITGGSVSDVLNAYRAKQQPMPIAEAIAIAKQTALALSIAHSNNLVHRDVKPSNILVLPETQGKATRYLLTDFGIVLAQGATKVTKHAGSIIGTTEYMSPEQAKSLEVDHTSDLYALGCVFYEMLTGNPPFMGEPWTVIYHQINTKPLNVLRVRPEVPRQVQMALGKLLAKQTKDRFQSADEFIAALDAPPPRTAIPLWAKASAAATFTGAVIMGVIFLLSPPPPDSTSVLTTSAPTTLLRAANTVPPTLTPQVTANVIPIVVSTDAIKTSLPTSLPQPTVTIRPIQITETPQITTPATPVPVPTATLVPPTPIPPSTPAARPLPPTATPTARPLPLPPTATPSPRLPPPVPPPPTNPPPAGPPPPAKPTPA